MVVRELFGRPRKACPECAYIHFRATPTAVGALVCRGREVLLVRRAIEPGKGRWGFPAGFQDYGETVRETAMREVLETPAPPNKLWGVASLSSGHYFLRVTFVDAPLVEAKQFAFNPSRHLRSDLHGLR